MNKLLIVFLLGCLEVSSANASEKLPIHKNQLLSQAKFNLIQAGWKPYQALDTIKKTAEVSLMERDYIAAGYIEVGSCGASTPYCEFNFKKGSKCLKVVAGSYEDDIKDNTVEGWAHECEK